MANSLLIEIGANIARMQKDMAAAHQSVKGFSDSATRSLDTLKRAFGAFGLYLGGRQVLGALKSMIDTASNLQEQTSKFNVVFTGQQRLAEQWAGTLVDSYAMSTREAKQYLAAMQDLLVPMGMNAEAAGKMSYEVVKLAADLGSFNNLPTEKVMLDMQSALVGNYETMKKYGVVLKETLVQEKALAMGLARTKDELTAGQKAQAAYELIVQGSRNAIGDMARTSDNYANVQKQLNAALEDFKALIGSIAIEPLAKFMKAEVEGLKGILFLMTNDERTKLLNEQRRIIEELNAVESRIEQEKKPKGAFGSLLDRVFGGVEEWESRKVQLEKDLEEVRAKLRELSVEPVGVAAINDSVVKINSREGKKQVQEHQEWIKEISDTARDEVKQSWDLLAYEMGVSEQHMESYNQRQKAAKQAQDQQAKEWQELIEQEEKDIQKLVKEHEKARQEMSQTTKDFAENAKWTMSEVFFDAMSADLKSFGDYWDVFWTRMKNSLARTFADMTTEWAMSGIRNLLLGGGISGGGLGGLLGGLGSLVGGGFSAVKDFASSAWDVITSIFHEGGLVEHGREAMLDPDEILAILQRGEYVLSKKQVDFLKQYGGLEGLAGKGLGLSDNAVANIIGRGVLGVLASGPLGMLGFAFNAYNTARSDLAQQAQALFDMDLAMGSSFYGDLASSLAAMDTAQGYSYFGGGAGYAGIGSGVSGYGVGGFVGLGDGGGMMFQRGGMVPRTGSAIVHQGEGVFTPEQLDRLSVNMRQPISVTVPVYIDGRIISETVYDGFYDASKRRKVTLHKRGVEGYTSTVGLDL